MKVVINACFGGFSVTKEAVEHMAAAGNVHAQKMLDEHAATLRAFEHYKAHGELPKGYAGCSASMFDIDIKYRDGPRFHGYLDDEEIPRHDPHLIAAVEALGADKAGGDCAALRIVEIPDGTDYEIAEYDGNEHIAEKHRTWG